jgi:hypothetical protein
MMKLVRICALGLASLLAIAGVARAEPGHHLQPQGESNLQGERLFEPRLFQVQDRPSLDGVISSLQSRYGPGQVRSVSEVQVGRDGREFYIVKYLTQDNEMIIVKVDARSGRIIGGG